MESQAHRGGIEQGSGPFGRAAVAIHIVVIILLGIAVYSNTFESPFVLDDVVNIVDNPIIKDLGYFSQPSSARGFTGHAEYPALVKRYISHLSFALNYRFHGLEITGFHITNLVIHLINGLLLYLLVVVTFRTPRMRDSGLVHYRNHIALMSALLFVCHPVQTQAVTYISQRFASMTAMFYIGSVVAWAASGLSGKTTSRIALYVISILSAVLAMKTKEIAFTLPMAIVMYEFMFFERGKRRIVMLVPLLLTMLIIPLVLMDTGASLGAMMDSVSEAARAPGSELSRSQYLLTQFTVIPRYVYLIFFPINQNLDYDWPVYDSFLEPGVFLSFMFLVSLLGLGVYMLRRSYGGGGRPAARLAAFGVFWFFLALSVESSVIPIMNVIFEHRVYLPGAGAFVALSVGAFSVLGRLRDRKARTTCVALLLTSVFVLSAAAFARNDVWKTEIAIWEDTVGKSPGKARPHNNLGFAYWSTGLHEMAKEQYVIAIGIKPDYADAHNNLGIIYKQEGLLDKAMEQYMIAMKVDPDYANSHNNIANVYYRKGMFDKSIKHYRIALSLKPNYVKAHFNLGLIFIEKGQYENARREFRAALRKKPDYKKARKFLDYISKLNSHRPHSSVVLHASFNNSPAE
jgi:tetratricopeptide (TPR) repeat protein